MELAVSVMLAGVLCQPTSETRGLRSFDRSSQQVESLAAAGGHTSLNQSFNVIRR